MSVPRMMVAGLLVLGLATPLSAQDTTQVYPWRLAYFPYLTASPNDGVMAMARVVWFRQSRWDDRVSVHDELAVEGGYSTKDSWLLRARGDFPRIGDGWRLQVIGQAEKDPEYWNDGQVMESATRQLFSAEVTRTITGPLAIAVRGEANHLTRSFPVVGVGGTVSVAETDFRGRVALVFDQRDREYDTRAGSLLQAGVFAGSDANYGSGTYRGVYGLGSMWMSVSEATRVTARVGARMNDEIARDASRIIPAWEDQVLVVGGPESDRALPIAARIANKVLLASVELRHDLFTFPGGAVVLLAFVDGGRAYCDCGVLTSTSGGSSQDWVVGPGAGVGGGLLRNAVLTATAARALGATRIYVGSGWSW